MRIILRYLLKSIFESKFRTSLIILSIALSCALYFASNAFGLTFTKMFTEELKQFYGNAEILIHPGYRSNSEFLTTHRAKVLLDRLEYVIGSIERSGSYSPVRNERQQITIRGFNYEDLERISPVTLIEESDLLPFEGNKVIVNRIFAEKNNLSAGNIIELDVNGSKYKLKIAGIAAPNGFLKFNPMQATFIVPLKKVARICHAKGRVNMIFVKPKRIEEKWQLIGELQGIYNRYEVREPINQAELIQELQSITVPFMLMTILVLSISVFIIYTSFKVITMERLPIIGTFRSVGATKKTTDIILLSESVVYGVIGGVIGLGLGFIILYGMAQVMSYDSWSGVKMKIVMRFTGFHVISALLLAIFLTIISSIIPILRISKIPIKDIVLNKIESRVKKRRWSLYAGIVMIMLSLLAPSFVPKQFALVVDSTCMIVLITGIIFLIPTVTSGFIKLFEMVYSRIFGNEGVIAVKNLKDNKSILNNISLLSIGIAGILMINVISYSVDNELFNFYSSANFQIWTWIWEGDRTMEQRIRLVDGVKDTYGVFEAGKVELEGRLQKLRNLEGVREKYLDFWNIDLDRAVLNKLHDGRNILITNAMKEVLKVKKGDILTIRMPKGKKNYKIIGFFDSHRNRGNTSLISDKYFKLDMKRRFYNTIFIKTRPGENIEATVGKIKKRLARWQPWITSLDNLEKKNRADSAQILLILKAFSILTMVIGIFGVLNNLIVNFIQRKRSFAMYRSIGMSKVQMVKMIFIESLTGGLIGGIIGAATGLLFLVIIKGIIDVLNIGLKLYLSPVHPLLAALAGMLITVIASVSPAFKTSKMNIIEAIKYE